MLRNTHQSERRGSLLDEQFGLPRRSAANIPEVAANRSAQRKPSKIGSAVPSMTKIQRSPKSKLSMISRNDQRKSTINSNMSSNKKQEKLLNEYKDLFQDDSFSSQSSSSVNNSSRAPKVEPKNIDKVIDQEMEFIHNTLNLKMSTISKHNLANQSIRMSSKSQSRPLTKSMKSMKQLSQYSKLKSSSNIAAQSIKFRKESSISSSKDVGSSQDLHSLVKILDKVGVPEQEQQQYQQIIEELEKQCVDMNPTSKPRIKQKVRKTFVSLLNQYYGDTQRKPDGDQASQFSIAANESIQFNNNPRFRQDSHNQSILKGQSQINVTSIMENVFTKQQNQSISERMKRLIEDIQINLDDESYEEEHSEQEQQEQEDEIISDQTSEEEDNGTKEDTIEAEKKNQKKDPLKELQLRCEKKMKRDPIFDPYPLIWVSEQDVEWAFRDYQLYWDNYPMSGVRKTIVLILRLFSIVVNKIINHRFFRICVLCSIIFNITVFIQSQDNTNDESTQGDLREKKKIILYLFIGENVLKLIGLGIFQFFFDLQNIFDIIILVLFLLHYNYPEIMVVDFSTARLFRLLLVMSAFYKRLQIMLLALKHSVKFLMEALIIVVIFSYFFALFGMHLFKGLFYYRCYHGEYGIPTGEECGFNLHCHEEGTFCARSLENPNIPTNFDDICYSYENVVRLMIFNEWTEPLYLAMLTFHDFTVVYFLLIEFIVGIFGANLIIAVLKIYYSQTLEEYEFEEIEDIEPDVNIILNLRIIKNYGFDSELKNNEQCFVRKTVINEKEQSGRTTFLKTMANPSKAVNYKHKFLSARQVREFKEVQNRKRGIKAQKSNLDNLVENFTLSRIFLAEQNKEQFVQNILANEAFDKDYFKLFYIQTLKENPIYSWRSKINKNYEYTSTSEQDIFGSQKNQEQIIRKREREFEFIRRFTNKHYYVIKKSEVNQVRPSCYPLSDTGRPTQEADIKFTRHFPIKKRNILKKTTSFKDLEMKQLQKVETLKQELKEPSLEKMLQSSAEAEKHRTLIRKISTAKTQTFNKKTILINDEECDYKEVKKIFRRKIPHSTIQPEDYEELFVKYRLEECQQGIIFKNNWNDVITLGVEKKQKIFHTLNSRNVSIWLTGLNGSFLLIQKYAVQILQNKSARIFFDFLVLTNIVLLSCIGLVEDQYIRRINDYLLFVLIGELILKILQQGVKKFCSNSSNILDTIVLTSTLTQSLYVIENPSNENIYLDLLNSFQSILIYRVIKYNKFAVKIANVTRKSVPSFFTLILLMITLMLMFAFVGMDLFRDKFPLDTKKGLQQSFDDLPAAFLTVFIRAANEDWIGMVILGSTYSYKVPTMFYSIIFVYVLNFMTIGFILAIVLDAFQAYAINDNEDNGNEYQIDTEISQDIENNDVTLVTQQQQVSKDEPNEPIVEDVIRSATTVASQKYLSKGIIQKMLDKKFKLFNLFENINKLVEKLFKGFQFYTNNESEYALFIFSKKNSFRKFCYRLIHYPLYVHSIQIIFSLTIIHMSLQTYYDEEEEENSEHMAKNLERLELALNLALLVDSILKIVALGFMTEKGTFTSELWRFVDFVYQVSYTVHFLKYYEAFQYIRYIRYTRPFRFLYLFEELKYINNAITKSLADLINILFVQIMVWLIFAIFGVIIYRQKMGYCEEPLNFDVNHELCEEEGKEWINNLYNFDNIANAMLTLYRTTACDDWVYIYEVCMNSRSADLGPIMHGNKWVTYIYFILFILVGVLFFMGFFAGILFINFQTNRTKLSKQILTKDQQLFADVTKMILVEIPNYSDPPTTTLRKLASGLVKQPFYEKLILLTILINTGILTFVYYEAPRTEFVELLYQIFTCFLILDTGIKILAFGIIRYWGFIWRKMELILSFIALVDLVSYLSCNWTEYYYKSSIEDHYFILIRMAFALRNLRTLLIIQQFKGLTRLLRILNFSASFLFQILCFLLAIMLFYGFIGCEAFGKITEGEVVTEYLNFKDIGKALLVLFKTCTKNQWVDVMIDVSEKNELCTPESHESCGPSWYFTSLYFYTYILISSFVAFNLFITALVDQFERFFHSQNSVLQTYIENIDPFRTTWCKYSSETKGLKMHCKHLANFLLELGPPLGALHGDNIWDAAKSASNFKIRSDQEGYIHFQEVLYETIRFVYREQIFREGSPESIQAIKQIDKDTRFRLHFKRIDILDRRERIFDRMYIKGNFNILQEYLFLLMIFRTLKTYSLKTILKIQNNILSPDSTQKPYIDYDSEDSDREQPNNNNQKHLNTIEQVNCEQIDIPKYNITKANKRLKFLDQSQDSVDENHAIYEPEGKGQMNNKLSMKGKSALKKQTQPNQVFNFVDFETMGQKQLQNPMLDSSHLNDNSKSMMTDSLIDEEDKILTLRTMNRNHQHGCRFSISSSVDEVGSETHQYFHGKPQREGRTYLI